MTETVTDALGALPDDDALRAIVRQRVEAAGTSFYWAMRLLPEERRNGMYAVYAFCREVDDIADDTESTPERKKAALSDWHAEIDALYAGRPRHLIARALREPALRYALRRNDFHAVIDGMEMDAADDIRIPDLATLDLYCARVASAVGHLSVHVFGDPSEAAHRVADSLGRALQLTNILRDLDEDARRGRLYLPGDILERHGIRGAAPLDVLRHPALPAACRDVARIAEQHFADASRAMARCSRRAMRPAAVMGAFYRAILGALRQSGWRDPALRVSLTKGQKLWLVLRHGLNTTATAPPAGRVHVVGAGLAGLAAAVELAALGHPVTLYEAGPQAGGRCRSFRDSELGVRIDNGNHLLLSGNGSALAYIERIGARDTFEPPGEAAIPFVDIANGERWTLRPGEGAVPWWVLQRSRRVPGTRMRDYFGALRLLRAAPDDTVGALLGGDGALFRRLWQPLAVAALNTAAEGASAQLFWRVLAETIGRGAAACRPMLPREGLSESLVDPALQCIARNGGVVRLGSRLKGLGFAHGHATELTFDGGSVALSPADSVILAVPAAVAARLVPGLLVPDDHAPIVNAHFRLAPPPDTPAFVGVVGGIAEWVFRKREVVSVTVSAADRIVELPTEELRDALWRDVARVLRLPPSPAPAGRIIKERRATFRATPAQVRRRPAAATAWANLHLAGDYLDTGLPATIEGAIRSGFAAAARVRRPRAAPVASPGPVPPAQITSSSARDYQRALS